MRAEALKGLMLAGMLAGASLAISTPVLAMPVEVNLLVGSVSTSEEVPLTYEWDREWLQADSYTYNHGLARISGAISATVYLQEQGALTRLWSELGGEDGSVRDYHYQPIEPKYKDKSGYSFGQMELPNGDRLVLVAIRGTTGRQEWLSNLNIADATRRKGRYHEGFEKSARLLLQDLYAYLEENGIEEEQAVFLVTGHSRGAAVADLVGAFLDRGEPDEKGRVFRARPERVFTYTFATPSSCTVIGERRAGLYQNIFNVINAEDAVPELPFKGGSWDYNNFGCSFYLPTATKLRGDMERYAHLTAKMSEPFFKLTGRNFQPMPGSEDFSRAVKNMQWAVGSVERFYKRRGKLGHTAMVNALKKALPENEEGKSFTEMLQERNHATALAAMNMHSVDTYNAWIISGEPEDIYMRGTPTLCRLRLKEDGGKSAEVHFLQGQLPLEIALALPGGETAATWEAGTVTQAEHGIRTELQVYSRLASFTVPEGERLQVTVKAPAEGAETTFELSTCLEANGENGLDKHQRAISSVLKKLRPGESVSYLIDNRQVKAL